MSDHIHYNFFRLISADLRAKLKRLGYTSNEYASNVCNSLRARGEFDLASRINEEIDESIRESRLHQARVEICRDMPGMYPHPECVPDDVAARRLHFMQ